MITYIKLDENGTLQATEHDKYEHTAACSWAKMEMYITAHVA
jgi:hypothetical protein